MTSAAVIIASDELTVTVARRGAELTSIRDLQQNEWLWQADPAYWARQAPVLFPVIGAVPGGELRYGLQTLPVPSHGFAPASLFELTLCEPARARLVLADSEETRRHCPFSFRLTVEYALERRTLTASAWVENTGPDSMPYAFGFHPGFNLPLPHDPEDGVSGYCIAFDRVEHDIHRVTAQGLVPAPRDLDLEERVLPLETAHFEKGAVVVPSLKSRHLWLGRCGHPGIAADLGNFTHLGLWSKPGAPFLCIEPWQGLPVPAGFSGDAATLPGYTRLPPGETRRHHCAFALACEPPWREPRPANRQSKP